jgi:membrane protease YdiL (CAAX protease family)
MAETSPTPAAVAPDPADDPIGECLLAWAAAVAGAYAAWRALPEAVASFGAAAAWILVAIAFHLAHRRSLEAAGLAWPRPARSIAITAAYAAVLLPLYSVAYLEIRGLAGWRLPGPEVWGAAFVGNLALYALPEECFFRGFVQPRLAARFPAAPRRVLGVPLTPAIALAAAAFAVTHVVFAPAPFSAAAAGRLLTFFPGLVFGALREETGGVAAPALFHAACNATLYALQRGYLEAP